MNYTEAGEIFGKYFLIILVFYIGIKHGSKLFSKKEKKETNGDIT